MTGSAGCGDGGSSISGNGGGTVGGGGGVAGGSGTVCSRSGRMEVMTGPVCGGDTGPGQSAFPPAQFTVNRFRFTEFAIAALPAVFGCRWSPVSFAGSMRAGLAGSRVARSWSITPSQPLALLFTKLL